jgi:hypothetical protein
MTLSFPIMVKNVSVYPILSNNDFTMFVGSSQALNTLLWLNASNGKIPPKALEVQYGFDKSGFFCRTTNNSSVSFASTRNCFIIRMVPDHHYKGLG